MIARTILVLCLACLPPAVWAQSIQYKPAEQVHWAAAAFFGTGWYKVDNNRKAFIFRIPPRQILRESGWDGEGKRLVGIEILYPLTLGLHKLDDAPDFIQFDNYGSFSFTPGVQVEVPVSDSWYLRPYAHLGVGYEKESGEWARVGYGGVRSRYLLGESEGFSWSLLNAISFAGYKPEYEKRGRYASMMAGLEFSRPLFALGPAGGTLFFNGHLTYSYFFEDLTFHVHENDQVTVDDEWEIGLAIGKGRKKMKLWFMEFEQVGLSFKFSSNGDYKAIAFNFRSPFTQ
jgi:hypothetical protein